MSLLSNSVSTVVFLPCPYNYILVKLQTDPEGTDPNKLSVWTLDVTKVNSSDGDNVIIFSDKFHGTLCVAQHVSEWIFLCSRGLHQQSP